MLQGGLSTGRTTTDNCELYGEACRRSRLQFGIIAVPPSQCHVDTEFLTQFKFLGTYLVPKIDVQFGATFQSTPGPQIAANELVLPSQAGLPSFSAAGVRLINLLEPGSTYTSTSTSWICVSRRSSGWAWRTGIVCPSTSISRTR